MSVIVLTCASGAPGVTTTALGLALGWHRPVVLLEADPTGGSAIAAGYLEGSIVPVEALIDLALAHQEGTPLLEVLPTVCQQLPGSPVAWAPGTRSHEQARTLLHLWEPLTASLAGLEQTGQDVIVDAGRLGVYGSPQTLIEQADLALLVVRSDLVALSGARSWAATLKDRFTREGAHANLAVLLVGAGEPFTAREVESVLRIPVIASIANDPASARVLSHGQDPPKPPLAYRLAGRSGWEDTPLLRSYRGARSAIIARLRENHDQLHATGLGRNT